MPLILSGNVATELAGATFSVDNSCRFDDGDTAWMEKDSSSVAEKKIGTISFWMKRGNLTTAQTNIITHNDTGYCLVALLSGHQIRFYSGEHDLSSTQVLRDCSAWYHIFANWDTTQAVAANRAKLYVNGVQVTLFATETYPDQNDELPFFVDSEAIVVGRNSTGANYFDGYLAEMVVLEGTAAAVTDFGEFNSDSPTIWQPIKHAQSGNKGANGFYLDFKDSANLGNDAYGGTDLAETDLAATDQMTDTPTLNYCVWNPLTRFYAASTFSQGNLRIVNPANTNYFMNTATFGLSKGLWYWEVKNISTGGNLDGIGITDRESRHAQNDFPGGTARSWCLYSNGDLYNNNVNSADFADEWTTNDIMGIYLDLTANKLYFAKNGTVQNSGTGIDITAASGTEYGVYFPMTGDYSGNAWTGDFNFGGGCNFAISSAVADDDGSGAFEYDPTAGTFDSASKKFYAINSKNLAEYG